MYLPAYYRTGHWVRTSKRIRRKFPTCYCCESPSECVHHRHYDSLNRETEEDLVALCHRCHGELENGVKMGLWTRSNGHKALLTASSESRQTVERPVIRLSKEQHRERRASIFDKEVGRLRRHLIRGSYGRARTSMKKIDKLIDESRL